MFLWRDNIIYDECFDTIPATAVLKGTPQVVEDVFGFWLKDRETVGEEVTFAYRCRQVLADKLQGTGEAIRAGMRLYAIPTQANFVTPNRPAGVAGVAYRFCGWAKEDADENAEQVLMNFDGTRWDEVV